MILNFGGICRDRIVISCDVVREGIGGKIGGLDLGIFVMRYILVFK